MERHLHSRAPTFRHSQLDGPGPSSLRLPSPYGGTGTGRLRNGGLGARGILATRRQELSSAIVEGAHGFPYSRKLEAHRSCVNALAFSSGDGRFLASGGDDLRICLWDFHQDDVKEPSFALNGPKGNILCLEFSATNRYLYSGGLCETVFKHDISNLSSALAATGDRPPDDSYRDHCDSIRALTCHPVQDEVFMSTSEDGTIRRYDGRQPRRAISSDDIIQTDNEVTGVQYHPSMENLFVTSDGAGRVFLRDARMAFGPMKNRSNEGIVQRYNTKLTKKSVPRLSNPEASSVSFDKNGSKLAVTFLHYLPTIYAISDPEPVAVLSGHNLPDGTPNPPGQRTYTNSCTMKHGSFGGPGLDADNLYAGGSDDFRCYIWKIPPLPQLMEQRQMLSVDEWDIYNGEDTIAFTEGRQERKIIPVEIKTPLCRLTGHNSIVNSTVFHPHFLHVVTAGVEKSVVLHSPTPSSPCTQNLDHSPADVRSLDEEDEGERARNYYSALLGLMPIDGLDDHNERHTLSLFDQILREEGSVDIFAQRPWKSPHSSDDEDDEDTDDEDDGVDDGSYIRPRTFFFNLN